MCGIAGYSGQGSREILEKMTNVLEHRGPDGAGFFVDGRVGLGHRRLAIIDLSPTGRQPMSTADGRVTIVFNGEIYNFIELRMGLEKAGYRFLGASDTEVILAAYQVYGLECFKKMNGMFALALYDQPENKLILARDRLGKKPLYWGVMSGTLMFASELKAMVQHPLFRKEIDLAALNKYLAFDYVPTPHTIYQAVYKLEPGYFLEYQNGQVSKEKFWDIKFNVVAAAGRLTRPDLLAEMDARLSAATASRLVADVPLGVFLSGGLDSSTIAYYAQKNSRQKIKTFSIGFAEKSFDESQYAERVAKYLGTDHHHQILTAKDALDIIPALGDVLDEPLADYSIISTLLLSRFTRQHVTVALGGDGGDELFFGYPTFVAESMVRYLNNAPAKFVLNLTKRLLPTSHAHFNTGFKLNQLLAGLDSSPEHRHHDWMGNKNTALRLSAGMTGKMEGEWYEEIDGYFKNVAKENRWNQLVYLYLRTYLMDQVLVKVDRASMAYALEVRAPLLDYEFVDFVNSVPYTYKLKGLRTKQLLKELMVDKLPLEIVERKKQGFAVPLSAWFTNELKPLVLALLSEDKVRQTGILNPKAVAQIVNEHLARQADHRKTIWNLLVFQMWWERWM